MPQTELIERFQKLKTELQELKDAKIRYEAEAKSAKQALKEIDEEIEELGFDPSKDLDKQRTQAEKELKEKLDEIEKEVEEIRQAVEEVENGDD
jgi:uncharacterized protein YukE